MLKHLFETRQQTDSCQVGEFSNLHKGVEHICTLFCKVKHKENRKMSCKSRLRIIGKKERPFSCKNCGGFGGKFPLKTLSKYLFSELSWSRHTSFTRDSNFGTQEKNRESDT